MRNIIYIIILSLFLASRLYGQNVSSSFFDVTPTTPAAAANNSYANIEVDHYTGVPNINVPLIGFKNGKLNISTSLSYHASGIQVEQQATCVGLGWTLNAGGIISRQVQGIPDDDLNGGYPLGYATTNDDVVNLGKDSEPDIFTYSFAGYHGKFYFENDLDLNTTPSIIPMKKTELLFEELYVPRTSNISDGKGLQGFIITTPDGSKYYFGKKTHAIVQQKYDLDCEYVYNQTDVTDNIQDIAQGELITSWYLSRIESFDGVDVVDYHYIPENYSFYSLAPSIWDEGSGGTTDYFGYYNQDLQNYVSRTCVKGKKLSYIQGRSNILSFHYMSRNDLHPHPDQQSGSTPSALEHIDLNNVRRYTLNHDYFSTPSNPTPETKRLKLEGITDYSTFQSGQSPNGYTFDYQDYSLLPSKLSKGRDHWGYPNGKDQENNNKLLSGRPLEYIYFPNEVNSTYSDRRSIGKNESLRKEGILTDIKNPSGGTVHMTFEGHEVKNSAYTSALLDPTQVTTADNSPCGSNNYSYNYPYGSEVIDALHLHYATNSNCNVGNVSISLSIPSCGYSSVKNLSAPHPSNVAQPSFIKLTDLFTDLASILSSCQGSGFILGLSFSNNGQSLLAIRPGKMPVGGLRILDILEQPKLGKSTQKFFSYDTKDDIYTRHGDGYYASVSDGRLFTIPKYRVSMYALNGGGAGSAYNFISGSNVGVRSSYFGGHVGYPFVRVLTSTPGDIQYSGEEYRYYIDDKLLAYNQAPETFFPQMPTFDYQSGTIQQKEIYHFTEDNHKYLLSRDHYCYNEGLNAATCYNIHLDDVIEYDNIYKWYIVNEGANKYYAKKQYALKSGTVNLYNKANTTYYYDENDNQTHVTSETAYTYSNLYTRPESMRHTMSDGTYRTEKKKYIRPSIINSILPTQVYQYSHTNPIFTPSDLVEQISHTYYGDGYPDMIKYKGAVWSSTGAKSFEERTLMKYENYDGNGYPTSITKDGWQTINYTWNANGMPLTSTFLDHTKTYTYYPDMTLLKSVTDIDGTSTSFTYDDFRRLETETDDQKNVTTTSTYHFGDPTMGENYIHRTTSIPTSSPDSELITLESTDYQDGFGRTILHVEHKQGSTDTKDRYEAVHYDYRGRVSREYQPYQLNAGTGFVNPYHADYVDKDHTQISYDFLDRKTQVQGPENGATKYRYHSNQTPVEIYGAHTLHKIVREDPLGRIQEEYVDIAKRHILSRAKGSQGDHDTYTLYDLRDRKKEVVPPGSTIGNTNLNYLYSYTYDNQLASLHIPDKGLLKYKYNNRRDVYFMQNPMLTSLNKYIQTLYDDYGREVESLLSTVGSMSVYSGPSTEDPFSGQTLSTKKYGTVGIQKGKLIQETYRNIHSNTTLGKGRKIDYGFDAFGRVSSKNASIYIENKVYRDNCTFSYDLADNIILKSTDITDDQGNTHTAQIRNKINTVGRVKEVYHTFDTNPEKLLARMTFNRRGQINTLYHDVQADNSYYFRLTHGYRKDGSLNNINTRFSEPSSGGGGIGGGTIQSEGGSISQNPVPHIYHLRLTYLPDGNIEKSVNQVNGANAHEYTYTYDDYNRLQNANYKALTYSNTTTDVSKYNTSYTYDKRGNILTLTRRGPYINTSGQYTQGLIDDLTYTYQSDNKINSISEGLTGAASNSGVHSRVNNQSFTYDNNGNMQNMAHENAYMQYSFIDLPFDLRKNVGDDVSAISWIYSSDGQAVQKKVERHGNLLQTQVYVNEAEYANGELAQVHHPYGRITPTKNCHMTSDIGGTFKTQKTYYGSDIQIRGLLKSTADIDLRVTKEASVYGTLHLATNAKLSVHKEEPCTANGWQYEYAIRDHLGSTRVMVSDLDSDGDVSADEIMSEYHYYPFGMEQTGDWQNKPRRDYKYRYNGKEMVNDLGLRLYSFDTRYYDPALIDFMSVDIASDMFPSHSPYNYAHNNPVRYRDYLGMGPDDFVQRKDGTVYWDDNATSQATTKDGETYLGKNVLVGTHNRGTDGNEPINSAKFDLYLESNRNGPTATIMGNTVPADVEAYGTVAEGLYSAEYATYKGDGALLINGGGELPTVNGNPNNRSNYNSDGTLKPVDRHIITEVFFHKGNTSRESLSTLSGRPISAGCQTGGCGPGSLARYRTFIRNAEGFTGNYYLRAQPRLPLRLIPMVQDNTRVNIILPLINFKNP